MANSEVGDLWAAWLREQFDRHRTIRKPADLVRAAGLKENGRPVIDASRVTGWMRGQRPSFELAVVAAEAFGVPQEEALRAGGYPTSSSRGGVTLGGTATARAGTVGTHQQDAEPDRLPVGAGIDPELLLGLDPAELQRVEDFIRGMKAARGE